MMMVVEEEKLNRLARGKLAVHHLAYQASSAISIIHGIDTLTKPQLTYLLIFSSLSHA
jgi:hypothetical protein